MFEKDRRQASATMIEKDRRQASATMIEKDRRTKQLHERKI